MFKKIKALVVSFLSEAEARHELAQKEMLDRMHSAHKMSLEECAKLKQEMSNFPSHINLMDTTQPSINLVAETAEQTRKDEEFLLFRKAQLAKGFNEDINRVGLLTQVTTIGGIINEMRKQAFPSNGTDNSNKP